MPPTKRIVERVAERAGLDPLELPPLYQAVDPDALNVLVETIEHGSITFEYVDEEVTVYGDGTVELGGLDRAAPSPQAQD